MLPLMADKFIFKPAPIIQLGFGFNTVRLDKSLFLEADCLPYAPNGRKVRTWNVNAKAENSIVKNLVKQFKKSGHAPQGKNVKRGLYESVFSCILANLFWANDYGYQVLYSRDTTGKNRSWLRAFDFLSDNGIGLIHTTISPPGKHGVQSWAQALPELINLLNEAKTKIRFDPNKPSIEVRDNDKNVLPVPRKKQTKLKYDRLERQARAFNEHWLEHSASLNNKLVVPFCTRKFNHKLELGGRFYADYQRLPQAQRKHIKIDSVDTVELDYKSIHVAILYAWEGLRCEGEAYQVEGFERNTIKSVMLRLVNIENLSHLKAVITRSANPDNQAHYKAYRNAREAYEKAILEGLPATEPRKAPWMDSFIENIPIGTDANKLIQALSERHRAIFHHIGSENIGLRLQAVDSEIMALVLSACVAENIPALPVHDSLIVRQTDKAKARLIMQTAFHQITGKHCLITQKD